MISDYDKYLFHEGKCTTAYNFMGAHLRIENRKRGARFTVWAPNAKKVYIVGSFNNWNDTNYELEKISDNGLWSGFFNGISKDDLYKFKIIGKNNEILLKADPFGRKSEVRPNTASIIKPKSKYKWSDKKWKSKQDGMFYENPINIYEVHLGSWKKQDNKVLSYRDLASLLPKYVKEMGYTHIELLPIMEHPLDESWGYQITGFYSPTSRYGDSEDLKYFIDECHKENIGVILDWVPGHFCRDSHGLAYFDGAACYEYVEGWKADNKGWGTLNFDLGRPEVRSFLISNAIYWIKEFHIDGFRMDAVTNMIYLSYGRNHGEWMQNSDGTDINYDGVSFIKELNSHIIERYPNIMLCAEESTTFPKVSFPVSEEGLGFHFKWNMGWMNDTLTYIEDDPIYRQYIHEKMNFSMAYHYNENFILPLSHDEVVHGKKSLVNKMWGDYFNKFAGLRAYMVYKMCHPGKKLLFMGGEIGQFIEWNSIKELDWHLLKKYEMHNSIQKFFKDLNKFYLHNAELWSRDYDVEGFKWIDPDNKMQSIYSFIRKGKEKNEILVVLINFTPRYYEHYEIEVPKKGTYIEVFNSDNNIYGGSGKVNLEKSTTYEKEVGKLPYKIKMKIPPMGGMILRYEGEK